MRPLRKFPPGNFLSFKKTKAVIEMQNIKAHVSGPLYSAPRRAFTSS